MIKFFRTNQPLITYLLLPVAFVFLWPVFLSTSEYKFDFLMGQFLSNSPIVFQHLFVFTLLVLNSIRINAFVIKFLKLKEKNYLASFYYLLLSSAQIYWFGFSVFLISTPFLLISLDYLLRINHQKRILNISFRVGFWLGIAVLIEQSLILLFLFYLVSFLFSRKSSFREWFVLAIGFGVPFLFYGYFQLINYLPLFSDNFHLGLPEVHSFWHSFSYFEKTFVFSSLLIFILSSLAYYKNYGKSVYYNKVSKKTYIIVVMGFLLLGLINSFEEMNDYFAIIIFIFSTFVPSYFLIFRKEKIGDVLLSIYTYLVIFMIIIDYFY